MLVDKCKIYGEDNRVRSTQYKSVSEKKNGDQNCGKPYANASVRGNQGAATKKGISGGATPFTLTCFRYGKVGHHVSECKHTAPTCFRCVK